MKDLMEQGMARMQANDPRGAVAKFRAVVDNPNFERLQPAARYTTLTLLVSAECDTGDGVAAQKHLDQAGTTAPELRDLNYWEYALSIGYRLNTPDTIAEAVTKLATDYPEHLNDGDDRYLLAAIDRVKKHSGSDKYRAVLEALQSARYRPANPFLYAEHLKMDLVRLYVDQGRIEAAKPLAQTLTEPYSIVSMQVDKRFAGFVPSGPDRYLQAGTDTVATARDLVAQHPGKIEAVHKLAEALLDDDQPQEALALTDATLARVAAAPRNKPAFDDIDDQLAWMYDARRRIFEALGGWDEAVAAQIKARDLAKSDPVSQRSNLVKLYVDIGRPSDALAVLKTIDTTRMTPYGIATTEALRACANAQLGDQAGLSESLTVLKAHAEDSYDSLASGLLCAGDIDALAALTIKRLEDPDQRIAVLIDMQTWQPPAHMTAYDKRISQVRDAVYARPEVRAAALRYGVINSYPATR